MQKRLYLVGGAIGLWAALIVFYLCLIMREPDYLEAAQRQSHTTVTAGYAEGTIYDRHFAPLVNRETAYYAASPPTRAGVDAILPHVREISPLLEGIRNGEPFVCEVDVPEIDCPDVTVLEVPVRGEGHLTGQHLLGYTLEHTGVTGLENDYDARLRQYEDTAQVTYTVDARGNVLPGIPAAVSPIEGKNGSVVTTLDADIQALCEAQEIEKGAIVVMDVQTGDILGLASFPAYDPDRLGDAISSEDAPLIDRALCPYSVGSIFKLVTCAAAYRSHRTHFETVCTGKTEIKGQVFRCHDWRGHGRLDMKQAMIYSCNTYFIELSQYLEPRLMRETAQDLGFGTQIILTKSIISQSGTLPTMEELERPAEMANFCFGQGKLTATPLQVTQMTCGIANNGKMPIARLILGFTDDDTTLTEETSPRYARILTRDEASYLQEMMIAAINQNPNSNAVPEQTFAAGKTSTAQTGRYDDEGTELCHAWITGYFPIDKPRYAVTVLVEDGGYGNDAAAPIFRELADQIMRME